METVTLLMLAASVNKIVSTVKAIGKDNNMALTQLVVWVVGTIMLALAAHATITGDITPFAGAAPLQDFNAWDLILGGIMLGSTGSFAYDWKKARDNTDSSTEPPLVRSLVPAAELTPPVTAKRKN